MRLTRLGLQITNFTYPGVAPDQLFERVAAQTVAAEQSGFDTVFVMDHFFQLPSAGPPSMEMFEAYTLLGALAARTERVRLGTLVTGVTYRNPALLAKCVTALDVISKGRALLGIGAAWFELEHNALGFGFPPLRERYERLVDALEICRAMFTENSATYTGTHHSVMDAYNSPRPIQSRIPILIGGDGERKTFRIAAQYADEVNFTSQLTDLPRKIDALQGHLDDIGRDRAELSLSPLVLLFIGETHDAAVDKMRRQFEPRGVDVDAMLTDTSPTSMMRTRILLGDPDEVQSQVQDLMGLGLDGLVVIMPADAVDTDGISLAGATLGKMLA